MKLGALQNANVANVVAVAVVDAAAVAVASFEVAQVSVPERIVVFLNQARKVPALARSCVFKGRARKAHDEHQHGTGPCVRRLWVIAFRTTVKASVMCEKFIFCISGALLDTVPIARVHTGLDMELGQDTAVPKSHTFNVHERSNTTLSALMSR